VAAVTALRRNEVVRASYVWRDAEGQPWLLTFAFAELRGRLECVGMELRSYLAVEAEEGEDRYPALWTGEPIDAAQVAAASVASALAGEEARPHPLEKHDPEALLSGAAADSGMMPRPLRAGTLRGLPLADVITRVRRQQAAAYRGEADYFEMPPRAVIANGEAAIERWTSKGAEAFTPAERKGGRPARWTRADLERAAAVYRAAYASGSSSPTKAVAEALDTTRNMAAKLVMRCRDPRVGLLGPTTKARAGGVEAPPAGDEKEGE